MLFLFNDAVFDVGDPHETALEPPTWDSPEPPPEATLMTMRVGKAVKLAREWVFEDRFMARNNPAKARFLSALLAWKTDEANALLAVCPREADSPAKVQIRLASVSLVTLQQLRELQDDGKLSSHVCNLSVWSQAPMRLRA